MTDPVGINLLPASNEWVYDPVPHRAQRATESAMTVQNRHAGAPGQRTDYSLAIDQLQATYPACRTVSLVCAWFGNSTDVTQCAIYPSTTFIGGGSDISTGGGNWTAAPWRCSGLTQLSPGLIPISLIGESFVYGGTPSDPSLVRCIRDLKARGFRVAFYPFILMDCDAFPWRGRIGFAGADRTAAARDAVAAWLGHATPSLFTRDATNLTVGYAGSATDWTFRRMILHYANLCVVAGGVDLFLIGSEFRGLEALRGPGWTPAGTVVAGRASWDYPFVDGLVRLAADVRAVFDAAGLARDPAGRRNLITYSPDWSVWMGVQHADAAGQWPHLDQLYASSAIDLVSFDNYLPLSDWTSGTGGLDAANWTVAAPIVWPPTSGAVNGLGLSGPPMLASKAYLKANIEGGEKYNWFYFNSDNGGRGLDPNGSAAIVSCPQGDRLAQLRTPYQVGQELLANKMLRWWWHNTHRAVYDAGDGAGSIPRGAPSLWNATSKSITFAEYGVPSCDRCTNQPNVFYDPKSSESFTPFWSTWERAEGAKARPRRDDTLATLAREAMVEYWTVDGHNETSAAGVAMIEPLFMSVWNWDARPFPVFPQSTIWGDVGNWRAGTWIGGKGPAEPPALPDVASGLVYGPALPRFAGLGWSVTYRPHFATQAATHVAGRETRAARNAQPLWEIVMTFDALTDEVGADLQSLLALYARRRGAEAPLFVWTPSDLAIPCGFDFGAAHELVSQVSDQGLASTPVMEWADWGLASESPTSVPCRFADDDLDVEQFAAHLYAVRTLTLQMVRS